MKNFLLRLLIVISVFCSACSDDDEPRDDQMYGLVLQANVQIRMVDKNGNDLLDPANPNSLKRFKVYYLTDGKKILYNEPLMGAPGAYLIEKWAVESHYHLTIFLNRPPFGSEYGEQTKTTYLEYEDGTTATIEAVYDVRKGYVFLDRASYNGIPVSAWNRSLNNGGQTTFELVIQ